MTAFTNTLFQRIRPYVLLTLIAIVAYLPVSLMIFSLKNDILALEFPIKYFISECLHNGIRPFWFNTWGMGFPLESIITWSIFSPLQFLWGSLFHYSLYTLHAEFIFYVSFCGCSFYYLLTRHVLRDRRLSLLLSVCYMLSGFVVASSQWLLYITAAAFLPLIIALLFSLLKRPSLRSSLLFTCFYYCMITGIYVAFSIVITYILLGIIIIYLTYRIRWNLPFKQIIIFLSLSFGICLILLLPALLSSLNVLQNIQRGGPITSDVHFFSSNYFHPKGLESLLLPLSSVRTYAPNTEPLMLNAYIGLLPIILCPIWIKNKKRLSKWELGVLIVSILFILISFGTLTPLREWLNILPGFSYFRNAALFRIFFIFFFLFFISLRLQTVTWPLIFKSEGNRKLLLGSSVVLILIYLFSILYYIGSIRGFYKSSLKEIITGITLSQTIFINSLIQLFVLLLIFFAVIKRKKSVFEVIVIGELILNTLICTPFFTASSYKVKQVEQLFESIKGFPVQREALSKVPISIQKAEAIWYNTNVFKKEVSSLDSYWGPLVLKSHNELNDSIEFNHPVFYSPQLDSSELKIMMQNPDHIKAEVLKDKSAVIILHQNYFDGWKAFKDHQPIPIDTSFKSQMKIHVTSPGSVEFIYKKANLFIVAVIIDILILLTILILSIIKLRRLHIGSLRNSETI